MMSLTVTVVKSKVNRPNACFTTLCQSTDFDDQSNLSPIVQSNQINNEKFSVFEIPMLFSENMLRRACEKEHF
jgi:hypothetical protein